jgi:hypothetical protein
MKPWPYPPFCYADVYWIFYEFNRRFDPENKTTVYEEDAAEVFANYIKIHNKAV